MQIESKVGEKAFSVAWSLGVLMSWWVFVLDFILPILTIRDDFYLLILDSVAPIIGSE